MTALPLYVLNMRLGLSYDGLNVREGRKERKINLSHQLCSEFKWLGSGVMALRHLEFYAARFRKVLVVGRGYLDRSFQRVLRIGQLFLYFH